MRERTMLEDRLGSLKKIERDLDDAATLVDLGEAEGDQAVEAEGIAALRALKAEGERRELEALLSGEADANNAYLEVHAGAGGTESQDWAAMLTRMYVRWAEQHRFKVEYIEETAGEAAVDLGNGKKMTEVPMVKPFTGGAKGVKVNGILLTPLPVTREQL
jgi:peptide chain release factor 2